MPRFKSLSDAIFYGDVDDVRSLLSTGTSPNEPCKGGSHPLLFAIANLASSRAMAGRGIDIVKLLINAKAKVDATDSKGNTALHRAVGHSKYLRLLLSAGASLNILNADGETPLLCAVKYGDAKSVQKLIKAGANVDPVNSRPNIRLHMALLQKDWDTVKSLLKSGAPTNYINIQGESPLILAIAAGQIEMVQQLIDAGADVNYLNDKIGSHDGQLKSPLHDAVRGCNVEIVKLLLKRGADPNRANAKRYSVLSTATRIERNRVPILNLLLDYGADMYNSGFRSGTSGDGINELPFEGMIETNNVEGVRLFLERGFDMKKYQAREYVGERSTALHAAIAIRDKNSPRPGYKDTRMLSLLLDHYRAKGTLSTELERGREGGWSPLFYAVRSLYYYERVAVLLKAGADPNLKDGKGRTALEYVLSSDTRLYYTYKNVELLIEYGAHVRSFVEELLAEAENVEDEMWRRHRRHDDDLDNGSNKSSGPEDWDSDYADSENSNINDEERSDDRSDRQASRSLNVLMRIVKCRVLYEDQTYVNDPIYPMIKKCDTPAHYYNQCNAEIDFLRTCQVDNSVTYYDILTDKEFWRRMRSSDAFEKAHPDVFRPARSIYTYIDDLKGRLSSGYDKYRLWKPAMKGLERLLGINKDTYYLIFSNVLNCLDIEDWRSLNEITEDADSDNASSDSSSHSNS